MREYDDETLSHLQKCELIILKDFVDICNKNGLTFFACAGTTLGAIRHGGFIPWDDDIDIALPKRDMDKLIEIVKRDYSDKYFIINAKENIEYPLATVRMMLKGTQFCEETLSNLPLELGIFLDLYSFDAVADDEKAYRKQAWDAWWWAHVRILLSIPNPVISFRGAKGWLVRRACSLGSFAFRMVGVTKERAFANEEAARHRYLDQKTKRIAYMCDTDRLAQTYSWDDILPFKQVDFDGVTINVPADYEKALTDLYGDYMQLPPENQRKNHFPARLDFGPY